MLLLISKVTSLGLIDMRRLNTSSPFAQPVMIVAHLVGASEVLCEVENHSHCITREWSCCSHQLELLMLPICTKEMLSEEDYFWLQLSQEFTQSAFLCHRHLSHHLEQTVLTKKRRYNFEMRNMNTLSCV